MLNLDLKLCCVRVKILYSCAKINRPLAEMQQCDKWSLNSGMPAAKCAKPVDNHTADR